MPRFTGFSQFASNVNFFNIEHLGAWEYIPIIALQIFSFFILFVILYLWNVPMTVSIPGFPAKIIDGQIVLVRLHSFLTRAVFIVRIIKTNMNKIFSVTTRKNIGIYLFTSVLILQSNIWAQTPDLFSNASREIKDAQSDLCAQAIESFRTAKAKSEDGILTLIKAARDKPDASKCFMALTFPKDLGANDVPVLINILSNETDARIRQIVISLLAKIEKPNTDDIPRLVEVLTEVFSDNSEDVLTRSNAILTLETLNNELKKFIPSDIKRTAIKQLGKCLKDPDVSIRSNSASALEELGAESEMAIRQLIDALADDESLVRRKAIAALMKMSAAAKQEGVGAPLVKILEKESDEEVLEAAADALGQMGTGALEAIPQLIKFTTHNNEALRVVAVKSIKSICDSLANEGETKAIPALKQAQALLKTKLTPEGEKALASINLTIGVLEGLWGQMITRLAKEYPKVAVFICLICAYIPLTMLTAILLWLRPLWILYFNEILQSVSSVPLPKPFDVNIPLRYVLLIGFFHYHPRVLDAWVSKNLDNARENFDHIPTISARRTYVPVEINMEEKPVKIEAVRQHFDSNISYVSVAGEGGIGKTSLACELGKWAMRRNSDERLCASHIMLPVLLEQGLSPLSGQGGTATSAQETEKNIKSVSAAPSAEENPLLARIQDLLRLLIRKSNSSESTWKVAPRGKEKNFLSSTKEWLRSLSKQDSPSSELVRQLLKQRRILVIVDSFSEMSGESRQNIISGIKSLSVNALIVTSRMSEDLSDLQSVFVSPVRIEGSGLSVFMDSYLKQKGKRDLFSDPEFHKGCHKLCLMAKKRGLTALIVKLYADQLIATRETSGLVVAKNIPDLMLASIDDLNRHRDKYAAGTPDSPGTGIVVIIARALAWASLKQALRPMPVSRKKWKMALNRREVTSELRGTGFRMDESGRDSMIGYLARNMSLIKMNDGGIGHISFMLDPLSEYLAGLRLIEKYRDNRKAWRKFLYKAAHQKAGVCLTKEFLLSLLDCCVSKGKEFKVPGFVAVELNKLTEAEN
ncbi:MAG: HEAT repeat domain-containing protein [Pyrinomonadaceae bacterium]